MISAYQRFMLNKEKLMQHYNENSIRIDELKAIQDKNAQIINNQKRIIQQYEQVSKLRTHTYSTYVYVASAIIMYLAFTVLALRMSIRHYSKVTPSYVKEVQHEIYNNNNKNLYRLYRH